MRSKFVKIISCMLLFITVISVFALPVSAATADDAYTYDSWENTVDVPSGYEASKTFGKGLETEMLSPMDMYYRNEKLYVLDSGNGRVVIFDKNYNVESIIDKFYTEENGGSTETTLDAPQGIFVTIDGRIAIADTGNLRVIICDEKGKILKTLTRPESENFSKDLQFKPVKIVIDDLDNTYVLAEGFYYGAIVYDKDGKYKNFFGASKVKVSAALIADMFWRKFMNKKQLDYSMNYLPAAFTSFDIDKENFIYTVIIDREGSIRKLNFLGNDIFTPESGPDPLDKSIYGDRVSQFLNGAWYATSFVDIAISDDDFVFVVDKTKGRIFEYDKDSNLINVFGAKGEQKGTFKSPVAVETVGRDVLVLDQDKAQITVFSPTDYGNLIHEATVLYHSGLFDKAYDKWQSVLSYNSNCELAYRGIGRAYLQQGNYTKAMEYAKLGQDRTGYSKAFRIYRSDVARKYFVPAAIVLVVLLIVIAIIKRNIPKIKKLLHIKDKVPSNYRVGNVMFHSVTFYEKLHTDRTTGSLIKSGIIVFLFFIGQVISNLATGFVFNQNNITEFNAFFIVAQSIGVVAIWVLSEAVVGSLRFGHGTVRTIFNGTAAAFIPYTITIYINIILSQFLVYEEKSIMGIITTIGLLYTVFLLYQSVRILQKYDALEAAFAMVLDLLVAIIVILLLIIVYMLLRQIFIFGSTIYQELMYRID